MEKNDNRKLILKANTILSEYEYDIVVTGSIKDNKFQLKLKYCDQFQWRQGWSIQIAPDWLEINDIDFELRKTIEGMVTRIRTHEPECMFKT